MNKGKIDPAMLDWISTLTGEMLLFGLLGKIFYANPDRDLLQPLVDEEVFVESPFGGAQPDVIAGLELLSNWIHECEGGVNDNTLIDLKVDYTRLFVGTGKVPVVPWESAYFNEAHLLFQEQTLDVRAWYQRFGLKAIKLYKEPDDHIALELAFMAHLAKLGLDALGAQDDAAFQEGLEAQRGFLTEHLLLWGPLWCNLVVEHAKTKFYRGIALVLRGALKELATILEIDVPEVRKA